MYVLDVVADDIEGLADIMRILNDTNHRWRKEWGKPFERTDVVQALSRLIVNGSVRAYSVAKTATSLVEQPVGWLPSGDYGDVWYGITDRGRMGHRNWDPGE